MGVALVGTDILVNVIGKGNLGADDMHDTVRGAEVALCQGDVLDGLGLAVKGALLVVKEYEALSLALRVHAGGHIAVAGQMVANQAEESIIGAD